MAGRAWKEGPLKALFAALNVVEFVVAALVVFDALPWVLGEKDRAAYVVEGEPCVLKEDQADRTVGVRAAGTEHYQDR